MPTEQAIYSVPENLSLSELKSWLSGNQLLKIEPPKDISRIYLDTFDWRLFGSGTVLELTARGRDYLLTWRKLETGEILINAVTRKAPQFANDIIAPGLRRQLKEVLEDRTLLQHVSITSDTQTLSLLNDEKKTVMRVELRRDRVTVPRSTKYFKLPNYIYLFPYRGYEDVYNKRLGKLTKKGKLEATTKDPLVNALNCLEISPGEYNNRPQFELKPEQPAYGALCTILNTFRKMMKNNIEGACNDKDPEFLHDFLLAIRRTRCLLNRYSSVFPDKELNLIKQDFEWIEQTATPIRDLDISLNHFDDFVVRVDKEHKDALQPLYKFLKSQKTGQQRKMRVPLESPRYNRLMEKWRNFLKKDINHQDLPSDAGRPILQIASRCIWDIYQEVLTKGEAITDKSPTDELLQLHQISKRLGYQIEIFQTLYPAKKLAPLLEVLNRLQENLNVFHDLNLQYSYLLDDRKRMKQEQRTMPIWLEAIGQLAAGIDIERKEERRKFYDCFKQLSGKKMQKRFRSLFADNRGGRKSKK